MDCMESSASGIQTADDIYHAGMERGRDEAIVALLSKLDKACLGRTPEQSLRSAGNNGLGLWTSDHKRYISTHVTADLCGLADVIEAARQAVRR